MLLLAVAVGCNLNTAAPSTQVSTLPTNQSVVVTEEAPNQSSPTHTVSPAGCTPRADWTVSYTIVAGDTLADIARRTSATTNALAQGNCLSNPDDIAVGQQLRLPQVPILNSIPLTSGTQTYTNALPGLGIALDFPLAWTVLENPNNLVLQGPDSSSFEIIYSDVGQTMSAEEVANQCKSAGACIGNRTIIGESPVTLPNGLTGYRLDLSAGLDSGSTPMAVVFMVVNNRNLAVRGFGDLTVYNTILNTLRIYTP